MRKPLLLLIFLAMIGPPAQAQDITLVKHARRTDPFEAVQYTVKTGDTMWKIMMDAFDAKPEDLPVLYEEFRRLNPGIKDLDHIRAGQKLTVPSLQQIAVKQKNATGHPGNVYVMRNGDCLARVLHSQYGLSDAEIYGKHIKKIKELNPRIANLDYIQVGQKVILPDFSAQQKPPAEGSRPLAKPAPLPPKPAEINALAANTVAPKTAPAFAAPEKAPAAPQTVTPPKKKAAAPVVPAPPLMVVTPIKKENPPAEKETRTPIASGMNTVPMQEAITKANDTLMPAVAAMGGTIRSQGTYFMPLAGGSLSIDTAEIPVMDLDTGRRVILDMDGKISPEIRGVIEKSFPACRVISGPADSPEEMMDKLLGVSGYFSVNKDAAPLLVGEEEKVRFSGKWIVYKDFSRRNVFVINLLTKEEEKTPPPIRKYAARFGIDLVEIGGRQVEIRDPGYDYIRDLNHSAADLFESLNIACEKDAEIVLVNQEPVRIAYKAPLLIGKSIFTAKQPDETLLGLLKQKGFVIVNTQNVGPAELLKIAGIKLTGPPVKLDLPNKKTSLDIPAVQVGSKIVLSRAIDRDIASYIASTGMEILIW